MLLADKGLYNADAVEIFRSDCVELVVCFENTLKNRVCFFDYSVKSEGKKRQYARKNQRKARTYAYRHKERENNHQGRAHGDSYYHLICVLKIRNISCQPCYKA